MLEGAIYGFIVAIWIFIGAYRRGSKSNDIPGTIVFSVLGSLLMMRVFYVAFSAFVARSGFLAP